MKKKSPKYYQPYQANPHHEVPPPDVNLHKAVVEVAFAQRELFKQDRVSVVVWGKNPQLDKPENRFIVDFSSYPITKIFVPNIQAHLEPVNKVH